jgi:hypothetical protein
LIPFALVSETQHVVDQEVLALAVIIRTRTKLTGDQVDAALTEIAPQVFSMHSLARRHLLADTDVDGSVSRIQQGKKSAGVTPSPFQRDPTSAVVDQLYQQLSAANGPSTNW